MSMGIASRRALRSVGTEAAVSYTLNAPFTAANQNYSDAQVLDTVAEGITAGQLTVIDKDGSLAVLSNKCAFTAQVTPVWGDLGFYSQVITRALGVTLLTTANQDNKSSIIAFQKSTNLTINTEDARFWINALNIKVQRAQNPVVFVRVANTDYQYAIVLGGYDVNEVPWRSGETAANYLYGAAYYMKGGTLTTWTLLWRRKTLNDSTLYAGFSCSDTAGTIDAFRIPTATLESVLQPTALSTFTGANGTSLDAITPEVGGAWTEVAGSTEIETNRAQAKADNSTNTVAGLADGMIDCVLYSHSAASSGPRILFRYTDTDNYWFLTLDNKADNIRLTERNGGGVTLRANTAVAIATDTNYDMRVIADDEQIDCFIDGGDKISYGSASFQKTATTCGIIFRNNGDEADNFAIYPRTDATQYDAVFDLY